MDEELTEYESMAEETLPENQTREAGQLSDGDSETPLGPVPDERGSGAHVLRGKSTVCHLVECRIHGNRYVDLSSDESMCWQCRVKDGSQVQVLRTTLGTATRVRVRSSEGMGYEDASGAYRASGEEL